jgi:hypothetical protein
MVCGDEIMSIIERFRFLMLNEYRASVKQNNQGIWLVDLISITAGSEEALMIKIDSVIGKANEILNKYNSKEKVKE